MRLHIVFAVLAAAALSWGCDDRDCEAYADRWVQLSVYGGSPPRPEDRAEIARQTRAINDEACRSGAVTGDEYECVMNASHIEVANECLLGTP